MPLFKSILGAIKYLMVKDSALNQPPKVGSLHIFILTMVPRVTPNVTLRSNTTARQEK